VRARDAYGNSVESAPLSVTTPANLTLDFLTNQEENAPGRRHRRQPV
jgi:hypothetical protein